jgi:hypothetical protein
MHYHYFGKTEDLAELKSNLLEYYGPDLPDPTALEDELQRWRILWEGDEEELLPGTIEATLMCPKLALKKSSYPNVIRALQLLLLLPVTSASVERSNSALGFVKTSRRSTMKEDRLNSLLMVFLPQRPRRKAGSG